MASAERFTEIRRQVSDGISILTVDVITRLSNLWYEVYEQNIVEENIRLLRDHVDNLYTDITNETVKRKEAVEEDVKKLLREASDLVRLLSIEDSEIDLTRKEGVPLHTFTVQLNESLDDLRVQLKERHDEIEDLLVQQSEVCQELGESGRSLVYDPLPSAGEIRDFRAHLRELLELRGRRATEFQKLRTQIRECLEMLELENLTPDEQRLVNDGNHHHQSGSASNAAAVQYSKQNLNKLTQLYERLQTKCDDLRGYIDQTKERVRSLWKCLEVEQSHRDNIEHHSDYHRTAYDIWRQEYDRCETEKRANLKRFVDKVRQELLIMWERTLKSDDEKRRFKYFTCDVYTDDLIRLHEIELEEMNQFYSENEEIFTLIAERRQLWARMSALEEKANAPNRFNNRGGQLLREEKERKTIAHKLPKIENELRSMVEEFETRERRKFTVYGEYLIDMIEREWADKRAEKQKFVSARKGAPNPLTPASTTLSSTVTPGRRVATVTRTPGTLGPRVASNRSALKAAPNTTSVATALKRKMATSGREGAPAKRNILGDLVNSPRPKTPAPKALKQKTIATIHNAEKQRRSSGRHKALRKSGNKVMTTQASDKYFTADEQPSYSSVSYEIFEEFIGSNEKNHCRSSEIRPMGAAKGPNAATASSSSGKENMAKPKTPSRIARPKGTPFKPTRKIMRRLSENISDISTATTEVAKSMMTTRQANTPGRSPGRNLSRVSPKNKLVSTKDLPIIF